MAYTTHHGKRVSPAHAAMLAAYERAHNTTLYINQGARTLAEQAKFYAIYLRNGWPIAAKPWGGAPHIKWGKQHHALDINANVVQSVARFYRSHGIPVAFNVPREAWHMDTLDEAKLIAAAKRVGMVSAWKPLKRGQTSRRTLRVRRRLYAKGYRNFGGRANPYFSAALEKKVKLFQRAKGLTPDGVVGPATWAKLRA